MKKELLDQWCAALRSGDDMQVRGALRDAHGYCALGLLFKLIDPNGWTPPDTEGRRLHKMAIVGMRATRIKLGLSAIQYRAIIGMNDQQTKSFPEIADYIEANVAVTP